MLLDAPNLPGSQLEFKVEDKQIRGRWSPDGKRPMLELLHFVSIVKQQTENEARPNLSKLRQNYKVELIKGNDCMEIATLDQMLVDDVIPYTRLFDKRTAKPFRDAIKATLRAYLQGDTSMITDLRPRFPSWAEQAASASAEAAANDSSQFSRNIHQAADKTSRIEPAHLLGLLDLNRGAPSPCLSPTPSVADSVEFTETNPAAVIEKSAPASDLQVQDDTVMNDIEPEADVEEFSTAAASSAPMQEVFDIFDNPETLHVVIFFEKTRFDNA
jgi:hypothetical protein